jgi:hypothetical protein
MLALWQLIGSFAVATIGWLVLEFVGRPYRRFYDLRGEVIQALVQFANVRARYRAIPDNVGATSGEMESLGLPDDEIERLELAKNTFRELAARMSAFAENETVALWLARTVAYNPAAASAGLIGISNSLDESSPDRAFHRRTLARALRLKNVPGLPQK